LAHKCLIRQPIFAADWARKRVNRKISRLNSWTAPFE
jgi:hypothetical protein